MSRQLSGKSFAGVRQVGKAVVVRRPNATGTAASWADLLG
jgi:hypothetical protein